MRPLRKGEKHHDFVMESHSIVTCQVPSQMCPWPLTNRSSALPICFLEFFDAPFILKDILMNRRILHRLIFFTLYCDFSFILTLKKSNSRFRSVVQTHQQQTPEFPIIPGSHQHYILLFKCCFHCCHNLKRSKGLLDYPNLFPMNG